MNWFFSILSGVVCAAAGAVCAGYVANSCVEWYRMSSREGASGYFVIFIGLLGVAAGLAIGIISSRVLASSGFAKGLGAGLAIVVGMSAVAWLIARMGGDVPPTLRGDHLHVVTEIRCPAGWTLSNKVKSGYNTLTLSSMTENNSERTSTYGNLQVDDARQEDGHWVLPARVFLFTTRGKRGLKVTLAGDVVASFLAPIPAHPDASLEQWSDWLPNVPDGDPVSGGFRYRFRLQLAKENRQAEDTRAEAENDELTRRKKDLLDHPERLVQALQDMDQLGLALAALQDTSAIPQAFVEPLRKSAQAIAVAIRKFRETADPKDPDANRGAQLKTSFVQWANAWERAVNQHAAGIPRELDAIQQEAQKAARLDTEVEAIASLCDYYRQEWQR